MPPQVTCASALSGKTGNRQNCIFSFKWCISALPEFNQSLLDFISLFDSRLTLTLLYDSINIVINAFNSGLLGAWFRKKEVESNPAVGLCCTYNAPVRCLLFLLSQCNAEALDRWGGKTKHHLISCFLSNTSAKNYRNRIVYVKLITSKMWDVLWDTAYIRLNVVFRYP